MKRILVVLFMIMLVGCKSLDDDQALASLRLHISSLPPGHGIAVVTSCADIGPGGVCASNIMDKRFLLKIRVPIGETWTFSLPVSRYHFGDGCTGVVPHKDCVRPREAIVVARFSEKVSDHVPLN